ncbi:hypothetical protein WNJ68_19815 [Klebsiella grimontii]|uniref:hypothetical protein n=1 Tax=Klebsiella grimontii TaxID=2058152 RepID=UPI003101B1DC
MTKSTITREQLIEKAQEQIAFCRHTTITGEGRAHVNQCAALFEIALTALTAPDDVPSLVMNGICDMSDGGVDAQGIWNLCKAEITGRLIK